MKRSRLSAVVAANIVFFSTAASAYSFSGYTIVMGSGVRATASATLFSSPYENLIDYAYTHAVLKEDGTLSDQDTDWCYRIDDSVPLGCGSVAVDYSIHEGCPYCGEGDMETYAYGETGWTNAAFLIPSCKYYDPNPL